MTPAGGSGPDDEGPGFDQQPIEVAALADACARAETVDGDRQWVGGITAAANWFLGDNDSGVVMWDPETGGAFDGLEETVPTSIRARSRHSPSSRHCSTHGLN